MAIPFNCVHYKNGNFSDGLIQSDLKYTATITAAGGEQTLTVPESNTMGQAVQFATQLYAVKIVVENAKEVWFSVNGTAAVPAAATFGASTSELIPSDEEVFRQVKEGDILSFITAETNADVSLAFYKL